MAKALAFSPQLQNCTNQILGTGIILHQQASTFYHIIQHPPSPILYDNSKNFIPKISINTNIENVLLLAGRLPGVSVTTLPSLPYRPHTLRSRRCRLRLPSLSLLPLRGSRPSYLQFLLMSSHSQNDAHNNAAQESTKTVKCVIKGRVQGVFYRNWTVENANELGLKGWVRNRRDGSVEALFSGKPEAADEMMQRCLQGPPAAMVTALEATPCNEDPGTGFQRKPTV